MLALLLLLAAPITDPSSDAAPDPVPLWPDGAPGAVGTEDADIPTVRFYRPDPAAGDAASTGTACIVCPGGGYGALAMDHEGHQVAVWMRKQGLTAVLLKYRLGPRYRHPAPLDDVTRAVRLTRSRADELGIDPDRVGVMGFSAGGHLASTIATHYDTGTAEAADPIERQSSRPSFSILAYPVISLGSDFAHKGSRKNLLGDDPDPALLASLTNETQVTADTPPTFIFHTADDAAVPVKNALVYYDALMQAGVEAELHVFRHGRHGAGFGIGSPTLGVWPALLKNWMADSGLLAPPQPRVGLKGTIDLPEDRTIGFGAVVFTPDEAGEEADENGAVHPSAWTTIRFNRFHVEPAGGLYPGVGYNARVYDLGEVEPFPTNPDAALIGGPIAVPAADADRGGYVLTPTSTDPSDVTPPATVN